MLFQKKISAFFKCAIATLALNVSTSATPKLEDFPSASKIWIGAENSHFSLANSKEYTAQGDYKMALISSNEAGLKEGDHWATINPAQYQLESESLAIEERDINLQIDMLEDSDSAKLLSLEADHSEIETKIDKLNHAINSSGFEDAVLTRLKKARERLSVQKLRIESKFEKDSYLDESILKEEQLRLSLKKKKRAFQTLERNSILKAPFSGKLEILLAESSIQKLHNGETIWLPSNTPYARIVDNSQINLQLIPTNILIQHPGSKENLSILVHTGSSNSLIRAHFHKEKYDSSSATKKKWIFNIKKEDIQIASSLIDSQFVAHVFLEFDKPAILVNKNDIAALYPTVLQKSGWSGVIKKIWPTANIIAIAPQAIAIRK